MSNRAATKWVLFTFLAERYERRSLMITSNLVFSEWNKIFQGPAHHGCRH
ncbi:MAG: ATP-binding protein [Caldilineaceae bacterium]